MAKNAGENSSKSTFRPVLPPFAPSPLLPVDLSHVFPLFSWNDRYKDKVKDYNFGSLIRTNSSEEYGETNTIFGEPHFIDIDVHGRRHVNSNEHRY